jgi:hypothetical protein
LKKIVVLHSGLWITLKRRKKKKTNKQKNKTNKTKQKKKREILKIVSNEYGISRKNFGEP